MRAARHSASARLIAWLFVLALLPRFVLAAEGEASIVLNVDGGAARATIDVTGLTPAELNAWQKLSPAHQREVLQVFVAELADSPAVLGIIHAEESRLRFTPRYPLEPGVHYRVVFHRGQLGGRGTRGDELRAEVSLPKLPSAPTTLTQVYPSGDRLPENQLKFYLHFSAPMSRGEAYRHIRLLVQDGQEVDAPFLELGEELWDPRMQRFTLLCDPGRVKRGLKPREELGPVLQEGKRYTLVIDAAWRDATGAPLTAGVKKSFDVLPPDDTPIDPAAWQLSAPKAGTREPLVVRFPESLDHSLLERVLWVAGPEGARIKGAIAISQHETCWQFTPETPWAAGEHQLTAATTLEDLAGNAIGRPFEVDEFRPIQRRIERETVAVPFKVFSASGD